MAQTLLKDTLLNILEITFVTNFKQIDKKICLVSFKAIPIQKKDLRSNMSKQRKKNFFQTFHR